GDRDRPADHTDALAVRAQLAWQDPHCLVGVRDTGGVELPNLGRDLGHGHWRVSLHADPCSCFLILRHPPARLLAMMCRNISPRARVLIVSFSRIATVRAVVLS